MAKGGWVGSRNFSGLMARSNIPIPQLELESWPSTSEPIT